MKKLYVTFLIFIVAISFARAQSSDCCTAFLLFNNDPVSFGQLDGPGKFDPIADCSCLTGGEVNSFWFRFDCVADSPLSFAVRSLNGGGEYDFALFLGGCPCDPGDSGPAIACDDTPSPASPPFGATGMGNPAQFGIPGAAQFQPSIQMTAGQTYILVLNNVTNTEGFNLEFSPDSQIGQAPKMGPDPLTGPTTICPGIEAHYEVPPGPLGSNFRWIVLPATSFSITQHFNTLDWTFEDPGDYIVCVANVLDGCGFLSDFTCLNVEVPAVPVTEVSETLCFPGPYIAGNGEEFYDPGVYNLEFETSEGCDSMVILTLDGASGSVEISAGFVCEGDSINFEGEMVSGEGVFEKIYPNQFGCDSIIQLNLIIVPLEVNVIGADTLDCDTTELFLDASNSLAGGETNFIWTNPIGDTLDTDSILFVNGPGIYNIQVTTIIDDKTCKEDMDIEIIEDIAPPAGVSATGGEISCTVDSVSLIGTSSTPNVSFAWSGPGGFSSSQPNPKVGLAGTYTLLVTGENGCETTASAIVTEIFETLTATATGGTINCFSANVTLNGSSPDPGISYAWQGPNSTTYSGPNPSINLPGTYLLTVTDADGCTGTAQTVVAEDLAQPTAIASGNQILACNVTSVSINGNGSSSGPQFNYAWTTGDGSISSGGATLNPTVDAPGTYVLTVTNSTNGCTQAAQTVVSEPPAVTAGIGDQSNVTCFSGSDGSAAAFGGGGDGVFTYNWSNMVMSNTNSGLNDGNYIVTVTDGNGCTATASVTITQPPALMTNATATPQMMPGVNDGTATANPTGGTPGYTYMWSNVMSTPTITGLAPDNYTVTITDANGCQAEETVTVNEIQCFGTATFEHEDESCNDLSDGSATVILANATDPVTYIWSNDDTSQTITGLAPGNYSVTATDANECEIVASVTILGPPALNVNATATDQLSPNSSDGTATASPTGGTSPYTFEWSTEETTASITGLIPGEYVVTVTDANECEAIQTVTVEPFDCAADIEPPTAIANDVTVELDQDGVVNITATNIDNGSFDDCGIASIVLDITSFDCNQIGDNAVSITVTDVAGNTSIANAIVTVADNIPPTFNDCPGNMILPFCNPVGIFDLSVTDNCSADVPPIQTSGLPSGSTFPAGEITTQTFEVTDAGGNTAVCSFEISVGENMSFDPAIADVSCFGEEDGSIDAVVSGGSPDYTYLWSNDSTTMSINDLGPGMYSVTVTDQAGCEAVQSFDIEEPNDLVTTLVNIINESNNLQNGAVDVTVSGGVMPFTFKWTDPNGNEVGDMEDISGLAAGTYQLFVTDANGCVNSSAYTIQNSTPTNNPELDALIRIFPNPTTGWLTVEFTDMPVTEMDISIHGVIGQLVFEQAKAKVNGGKYLLNLENYPEGVYLIKLTIEGQVVSKRIVRVD